MYKYKQKFICIQFSFQACTCKCNIPGNNNSSNNSNNICGILIITTLDNNNSRPNNRICIICNPI